MSSTSNASLSGSSAATNTVVVTARDIEFSNYDSSTGKWGSAVMTMMILDSVTEGLEEYDERVYAVFRNHDDPTDLIEFSSEVDGLDTRVTTTDPMVPSAKYELYKVYGAISGEEYATTSQFYFQVPGKAWDFANDTVGTDDITLVSDWNNYGEIVTATKTYKIADAADLPAMNGKYNFSQNYNWDFTVNGETVNSADVTGIRLTSLVDEAVFPYSRRVDLTRRMDNLEDVDIVSSRITTLYGPCVQKPVHRFAIPETVTNLSNFLRGGNIINTKTDLRTFPMYIPDSVTRLSSFMYGVWEPNKLRMSPNVTNISNGYYREAILAKTHYELPDNATWASGMYIFNSVSQANGDEVSFDLDKNVTSSGNSSYYILGQCYSLKLTGDIVLPGGFGKLNSTINSTNTATSLNKIEFKEGITVLENGVCDMVGYYGSGLGTAQNHTVIKLPNSLTKVSNSCFYYMNKTSYVDFEFGTGLTTMGSDNFAYCRLYGNQIKIPGTVTSIGNGFFHDTYSPNGLDLSELSGPDVVAQQDGFVRSSSKTVNGEWWLEVTVAPGTTADWEARFPNYYNNSFDWRRVIWKEAPTPYGYVFYVESNGGQEKYVELQSQAEFESLVFTNYNQTATVGEDQIILKNSSYPNMITGISVGTDITSIPNNFCQYCKITKFILQPSTNTVTIGNAVCRVAGWDSNHIATINFNNRGATIGNDFFNQHHYVQAVKGFGSVTSVGNSFMVYNNINLTIDDTSGLTSIGNTFLANSQQFNSPIDVSNVTQMPSCFLENCSAFNQPLDFSSVQLAGASGVLDNCTSFNSPITMPTSLSSSATTSQRSLGILGNATSFNQPIDFSAFENANQISLLNGCTSFNSQITMPSRVRQGNFLNNAESFNQPITLPNYTESTGIYSRQCYGWRSFNQPITIPASWCKTRWYNNATLFEDCDFLTSIVTFSSTTVPSGVDPSVIQKSFSTTNETAAAYTTGVTFTGTGAQAWKNVLPDSTTSPYRKINLVEPTTEYGKLVYYPNYTTTWGVSSSVGTEPDRDAEIYDIEEFEDWVDTLSPAPYVSATGDIRFDSPNGYDLTYVDVNGNTQTIQYGVYEIRGYNLSSTIQHLKNMSCSIAMRQ